MCSEIVTRRANSGLPRLSTHSFGNTNFLWSSLPLFYLREQASAVPSFLMGAPPKLMPHMPPKEFGVCWCSPAQAETGRDELQDPPKGKGGEICTFSKAQDEFSKAPLHQSVHAGRIPLRNTQQDGQDQTLEGIKHCSAVTFDCSNIVNTCSRNGNCWDGVMSVVLCISIRRF